MRTTASHSVATRPVSRGVPALFATGLVVSLMAVVTEQSNPDWFGYEIIYQEGGAWLLNQGRDILFLLVVGAAAAAFGPEGYPVFRLVLAAYFAAFTFALLSGRVVRYSGRVQGTWLVFFALMPLMLPRFTIQIREGLALTLVIVAIGLLSRAELSGRAKHARLVGKLAPTGLMIAAFSIHSGTAILLVAAGLGALVSSLTGGSRRQELLLYWALGLFAIFAAGASALLLADTVFFRQTVNETFGWLADSEASMSLAKWLYWLLYGLGIAQLVSSVHALCAGPALPKQLRSIIGVLAIGLLPAMYVTALVLLAVGMPPIVVSALARILNMILALLLLVTAYNGGLTGRLLIFAALVLIDQVRVITESIFTTFGNLS